ncbi:sugar transferase [Yonghaparkia sp. Root332]|uniref:sugar transferase n=1 Tax=Yonghaparkia sp. Root332 TaxID=1736516 RepID=UPI0006F5691B|nr:sugar transferase [Yonghaparkia sp. Root332]KQV25458.1 hypothetical protein ASC54_00130 [Yonghaparkia sp. Root332]
MTSTARLDAAVKRGLDVIGAASLLVVTMPIMAVTALAVLVVHGRPVLFSQERPGRNGRIFRLRKFRTMRHPDQASGRVSDAERITPFGARLRATSLDELPSLFNVLVGDMSFVGPRPLLVRYLDLYSVRQGRRHEVRPGITGLAQVSGRNAISWEERLELDVRYVETRTLALDARILARTVAVVLRGSGVTDGNGVSMSEFQGQGPLR